MYFTAAGDAFCRAASVQLKCGSKHEAATQYIDASTCYKKADPAGRTDTYRQTHSVVTAVFSV